MLKKFTLHRVVAVIFVLTVFLIKPAPPPILAMSSGETLEVTVLPAAAVLGTVAAGYLYYKNRYAQPANAKGSLGYRGPGEFFIGGFLGGGFVSNANWYYQAGGLATTVNGVRIYPGTTVGIKLGYFLDRVPYFGFEAEGSIGRQQQPYQLRGYSPPLPLVLGNAQINSQTLLVWTMAFHFIGRYGFFPTQEVPFGRLQPYVGLGPGLVMIYAPADSAKNFSLEFQAGLRYMFTKHLGAFLEYKLSQQWRAELESQQLFFTNHSLTTNKAVFNFTRNQIILGLAYHF